METPSSSAVPSTNAPSPDAPPSQAEMIPPGSPSPVPPVETVVIPPAGASKSPFTPSSTSGSQPPEPPVHAKGNFGKRILQIIVFLVVLLVVIFGVRFGLNFLAANKEVTITYWGLWEKEPVVSSIIQSFESAHPKIKVQYSMQSPKQYRERLQAAIARGDGPDVFRFHNTWVPMLARDLMVVPATVMTAGEFSSTFYPVMSTNLVSGSSIYGIPIMIDGLGLYYNEDLLASAGVTVPTTWNDVLDVVPKLTVKNGTNIVTSAIALGTTGNVEHFSDILGVMILQNGAKLTDLRSKEATEALIFYHKFADPSDPVYTWNETLDNSVSAFVNGRLAMMIAPSWRAFDVKELNPNLHFKIAPIPQLPGNTVTWASYWVEGVSAKSKNQAAAWEFVKYLTSKETATKLYTEESKVRLFGEPYARKELGASVGSDPFIGAYISQAATAKSFPLASRTFDNGINDKLIKYLEDAVNSLSKGNSPEQAFTTAQAGFTQVLSTYGLSTAVAPTP